MSSSLNILGFTQDDVPDVIYVESMLGGRYEEDPTTVGLHRKQFARLLERATPMEEYL